LCVATCKNRPSRPFRAPIRLRRRLIIHRHTKKGRSGLAIFQPDVLGPIVHGTHWCIAKNGGGYTQRGVAKGLKVPCLFMITEVSIRCQKSRRLVYGVYPRIPPNTPLMALRRSPPPPSGAIPWPQPAMSTDCLEAAMGVRKRPGTAIPIRTR